MRPVGIEYHHKKGYQIVHQCASCGVQHRNKVARNTIQPDDIEELITLM
jgi:hypothetical protein